MRNDQNNPFSVVKASDFSDEEINTYWVDMPGGEGFSSVIKPLSSMPMILLGGKGSGKTHLMRHYSYQLQKIRHGSNFRAGVVGDGFLGVYMRCGAMNTDRFSGKRISDEVWSTIFSYFLEIWLAQIFLDTIIDILDGDFDEVNEQDICKKILNCFDGSPEVKSLSFSSILSSLKDIQREIDFKVNNCVYDGAINVNVLCGPGSLVFGIPEIIEKEVPFLKGVIINYLVDELEHFDKGKQKYLNTLIRDKRYPCSVKYGVRTYGMKTYDTLADNEQNREGHEFEVVRLDDELRNRKAEYSKFSRDLCANRLRNCGLVEKDFLGKDLDSYFETPLPNSEFSDIDEVTSGALGKTISQLKRKLSKNMASVEELGIKNDKDVEIVLEDLSCIGFPILEKAAVYLFYQAWAGRELLIKAARDISERISIYKDSPVCDKKLKELISHHKTDFIAQLRKENGNKKQVYAGLEMLVSISVGFPRHLLTILKHSYQESSFNGEKPFSQGVISIGSQIEGVKQASQWFFDESQVSGPDGIILKNSIERLAELFRLNRYSDKPTESSLIAFYCDLSKVNAETRRLLELSRQWSLLIGDNKGRKDKNTGKILAKFILNFMLAPHWGLPIALRGVIHIDARMLDSVFDFTGESDYEGFKKEFFVSRNVPFKRNRKVKAGVDSSQGTLI